MQDSLELIQLEVGLSAPVLEVGYELFSIYLIKGWWQSVWESTCYYRITINIPKYTILTPTATNDITIMKKVVDLKLFSRKQRVLINLVRLSL